MVAGCGTGKTYWVINKLLKQFPNVRAREVLFVTSRTITKDQQLRTAGTTNYRKADSNIRLFWNGQEDNEDLLEDYGIMLMTYDKLVELISTGCGEGVEVMQNARIIVFDECHTLFSDRFIEGISQVRQWIRDATFAVRPRMFIGLTATPNIIEYYSDTWGARINRINKQPIVRYTAEKMICTNFYTIPYLFATNRLQGKTMILCHSIADCETLCSQIQNSTIMVSPHSNLFTEEMNRIRSYIIKNESLPPTFIDKDGNERGLEVLITTSTMREGLNLRESSGVRNIVSCITDELHVTQFVGRCRYNIDNLVVADTYRRDDNRHPNSYLVKSRGKFKRYMENKECVEWFNSVSHLVSHDVYGVKKFILGSDDARFINYINSKWLLPKDADEETKAKYRIWRDSDKKEIIDMAVSCKLFSLHKSSITFIKVIKLLSSCLGYEIESSVASIDNLRRTYKLIISFDENGNTYDPAYTTIDE